MTDFNIKHLNALLYGVVLAQKRGIYSFEESAALNEAVKTASKLIVSFNKKKLKKRMRMNLIRSLLKHL